MPIFNNGDSYEIDKVIEHLKTHWALDVTDFEGGQETAVFKIDGETIAIASMPVQIPQGDIEGTAQYAYNWPTVLEDLKDHTGHVLVTIMTGQKSIPERFELLSRVLYSMFKTSDVVGVYQGNQSLLIPKQQYIDGIDMLEENSFPVMLWIYFGLRKLETGNCAYTYGLKDFNKQEIEIIDSKLSLEELYDFLLNITSYIIENDVVLKSGETIGSTADQKISITSSKGIFVEGESIKLTL